MNHFLIVVFAMLLGWSCTAYAAEGLLVAKSPYSQAETMQRLQANAKEAGLRIFDRVDHAEGAAKAGLSLRPTEVLIFGNPKGGTPLMQCAQTMGIDLPLKALVWQDADGQVWLGYNDPVWLARRHDVPECAAADRVATALKRLVGKTLAGRDR